jgi:NTP-dependent ternary system trypsin peptidase co-occuring protein
MERRSRAVPVVLPDGSKILAQATVMGGEEDVAVVERLMSFEPILKTVEGLSTALQSSLEKISPRTAQVEFGIEFAVESGALAALLVQGSGRSSLTITLTWGA